MASTHDYAGIAALNVATKRDAEIKSFAQALEFLKRETMASLFQIGDEVQLAARTPNLRLRVMSIEQGLVNPFGKATEIGVVVYDTVVVTYRKDETFTTDSGGFVTPMTCSRINQFTPDWVYASRADRSIWLGGIYGDQNANRFRVDDTEGRVVGQRIPAPVLKRGKASKPHGRLRFMMDTEGKIYSLNDNHPKELGYEQLQYDKIGRDGEGNFTGDYNAPLQYKLVRGEYTVSQLRWCRGVSQSDLPLELLNAHRQLWNMPVIELVEA